METNNMICQNCGGEIKVIVVSYSEMVDVNEFVAVIDEVDDASIEDIYV